MSNDENDENDENASGGTAWAATVRLLERVVFTPGFAAVGKLLLIVVVIAALVIVATRLGVPMPWGSIEPAGPNCSAVERSL